MGERSEQCQISADPHFRQICLDLHANVANHARVSAQSFCFPSESCALVLLNGSRVQKSQAFENFEASLAAALTIMGLIPNSNTTSAAEPFFGQELPDESSVVRLRSNRCKLDLVAAKPHRASAHGVMLTFCRPERGAGCR